MMPYDVLPFIQWQKQTVTLVGPAQVQAIGGNPNRIAIYFWFNPAVSGIYPSPDGTTWMTAQTDVNADKLPRSWVYPTDGPVVTLPFIYVGNNTPQPVGILEAILKSEPCKPKPRIYLPGESEVAIPALTQRVSPPDLTALLSRLGGGQDGGILRNGFRRI